MLERKFQRQIRQLNGIRFSAPVEGDLYVIFTTDEWPAELDSLQRTTGNLRAAIAGPMPAITELLGYYRKALTGLSVLDFSGRSGIIDSGSLGLVGTVIQLAQESGRTDLTEEITGLLEHDDARGTSLARTTLTYFESDRRIDRTAETLFIHRNTVKQRLRTVEKLLGPQGDNAPRSLDVHLALRTWALTTT